jgi:ATP-binding cassette subfamily B protein
MDRTETVSIPQNILDSLELLGVSEKEIKLFTNADLDLFGVPETVWVVTSSSLFIVLPERNAIGPTIIELNEIESVIIRSTVGSAFLQAKIAGSYVNLVRFTNALRFKFERFSTQFENLKKNLPISNESINEAHPFLCKECGLPLQTEKAACPRCSNQGAIFFRVFSLLTPHLIWVFLMIILMGITVALSLVPPWLTKILVDEVLTTQRHVEWLIWVVAALVGTELLKSFLNMTVGILSSSVGTLLTHDVRTRLFRKLQELSLDYYDRNSIGTLMTRLSSDVEALQGFVTQAAQGFLLNILLIIGIGIMLLSINFRLAIYVMIPIPFVILGTLFFWRNIYPQYFKLWDSQTKMANFLNGVLSGIRLVKAFSQENREIGRFAGMAAYFRDSTRRVNQSVAMFNPSMAFLFGLGGLIVWYAGGKSVLAGTFTLGQLIAFLSYIGMFYTPLSSLALLSNWLSNFTSASNRIFEVLDTEPTLVDQKNAIELTKIQGKIEFKGVTFGYDPYFPVLKNITLSIDPGEMIGIVGRSGSGKTTLISLLCRFYDPQKGLILFDDHDLRELSSGNLRTHIGLVLQEPFLFQGTIAENIAYGKPSTSHKEIIEAAKAAHAHDFIMKFPLGYDFYLGERGTGLSGGEKQRIGIARALLCDPPVLILDEATSSVDTEAEKQIQEALAILCKNRTTIAIAHRLSTLKNADRIYVLDDGEVVEFGSHHELLEAKGVYHRLVQMQSMLASLDT